MELADGARCTVMLSCVGRTDLNRKQCGQEVEHKLFHQAYNVVKSAPWHMCHNVMP